MAIIKLVINTDSSSGDIEVTDNGKSEIMFQNNKKDATHFWFVLNKDEWQDVKRFVDTHFNTE